MYLPAILADPIARDLGVSSTGVRRLFRRAGAVGAVGPRVGRQIDLVGGRSVLSMSNRALAAGLVLLGSPTPFPLLVTAWLLLGVGMGAGLYDAAFAALGRIYGDAARRSITGITLIAGFAPTVGWPLSAWGLHTIGWRETCFAWGRPHPDRPADQPPDAADRQGREGRRRNSGQAAYSDRPDHDPAAFVFAAAWRVTGAMAAHLPRLVEAAGATTTQAVFAGALIGPSQVPARISEASVLSRYHPLVSTRLACLTHPIGAVILALAGGGAASVFAIFHGAGYGTPYHLGALQVAAGDLRFGKLRLSPRPDRRARPDGAGRSAIAVRPADRCDGQPRPDRLVRA